MNKQRLIRCGRDVSLAYGTVVQNDVELPARIRNVLVAAGLETVGEVRETADETLLSFQDLGKSSVAHIRETLG